MLNTLPFSHVHPNNKLYDHIKGCSTGFLIEQGLDTNIPQALNMSKSKTKAET